MNIKIAEILEQYKKENKIFNYVQTKDTVEITICVGTRRYITYWLRSPQLQELINIEDYSN